MTETYTIRVEAQFKSTHNLWKYHGAPEPLHKHLWKVEAKFLCAKLDSEGIGIDFVHVEKAIRALAARFDRRSINDIPPFDKLNPTSENIAKWFYEELNKPEIRLASKLDEVTVWEGTSASITYRQF